MNKGISPEEFTNMFSTAQAERSTKSGKLGRNLIGAMAVTASVMSMNAHAEAPLPPNNLQGVITDYSQYTTNDFQPRLLDLETFKIAQEAKMSGVFQHPYNPESIITLEVKGDPHAESRIKADLEVLYGSDSGLAWQKMLGAASAQAMDVGNKVENSSFHIMDPIGIGRDVNYTFLDTDTIHLPKNALNANPDFADYYVYQTYLHEVGHSMEHQQMSMIDMASSLFDKKEMVQMEVGADFSSAIYASKEMMLNGSSPEEVLDYLQAYSDERELHSHNAESKGIFNTHQGKAALAPVIMMIRSDPEQVKMLTPKQIENMSEIVYDKALAHDIKNDISTGLVGNIDENDNILNMLKRVQYKSETNHEEYMIELESMNSNLDPAENKVEYIVVNKMLEMGRQIQDLDDKGLRDVVKEIALEVEFGKTESFSLTNHEDQAATLKVKEYSDFTNAVMQDMKESGIWDQDKTPSQFVREQKYEHERDDQNTMGM